MTTSIGIIASKATGGGGGIPPPPGAPTSSVSWMDPGEWELVGVDNNGSAIISGSYINEGGFIVTVGQADVGCNAVFRTVKTFEEISAALGFVPTRVIAYLAYTPHGAGQPRDGTGMAIAVSINFPFTPEMAPVPPASGTVGIADITGTPSGNKAILSISRNNRPLGTIGMKTTVGYLGFAPPF